MLSIGLVGCGNIAIRHLNAYRQLGGLNIIVTDIVPESKAVAEQYGVSWCDDPEALIRGKDVDVIDVCTPTPSHAEVMLKALDSGKHVFCEKPFTQTLEEANRIAEKAAQVQKSIMVGYPYRFHPAIELARSVVSEDIIGQPHLAFFRAGGRGNYKAWQHLKHTSGGAISEMMVHMLDLILWYFGEIAECRVLYKDIILKERTIEGELVFPDAEDVILIQLVTQSGTTVICQSDMATPSYMNSIEIHGSNGSLWTSILDYFPTVIHCKEARGSYKQGNNIMTFPYVDFFQRELKHFTEAIQNGEQLRLNTLEDSLKIMRLIHQLQEDS